MFDVLTYEQFEQLARDDDQVIVYKEIITDQLTPTQIYASIQLTARDITLLESNPHEAHLGRYSHLCFDPLVSVSASGKIVTVVENGESRELQADPFQVLREYRQRLGCRSLNPLCKFAGGFVGYLSYDGIRFIENIPNRHQSENGVPELLFRYCQNHISFDHRSGKILVATVAPVEGVDHQLAYDQAMQRVEAIIKQLKHPPQSSYFNDGTQAIDIQTSVSDADFCQMVDQAKQRIVDGDIFQVVLSREFSVKVNAEPFDVYRALRFSNPSPYMFYFEVNGTAFAGASPEKLVSIDNGTVETRPLAGTRPRGQLPDDELAADLLGDEKEVAEHMMLVDLGRNDIGRVAIPGTVAVSKLKEIEYYSRVIHISSTVQGQLSADKDVFDAIKAAFPAGTLSGAPKIRAMEIIDELEQSSRGLYGGVVCGIDADGNLDSCIAIRMAQVKDGVATVRAGAGVVYDSDPQKEADETQHKARAILEGIVLAGGMGL
jgi:anthranilate synthase component 1